MKPVFAALLLTQATLAGVAMAGAAEPVTQAGLGGVTVADLQQLANGAEKELRGNILPFWLKHTRDRERGGFYGEIDQQMNVQKNAPRTAPTTTRNIWKWRAGPIAI
ncbi:MAG: hypothetical protein RLZZ366_1265 [Pseudomonadota bacterium]